MSNPINITVHKDGPLQLEGVTTLRFGDDKITPEGPMFLCRCGASGTPPYCDGSHRNNGFDGSRESAKTKPVKVWEGASLRTRFDPNVCMHVYKCKPLGALREAELAGDPAAAAEIARVVNACPSGALTWEAKGDVAVAPATPTADVEVMEGGEVRIQREYTINTAREDGQPTDRATLCRCGLSRSKPWCDGRHAAKKDFR